MNSKAGYETTKSNSFGKGKKKPVSQCDTGFAELLQLRHKNFPAIVISKDFVAIISEICQLAGDVLG